MNITSEELYEAIRETYQEYKDHPENFAGMDDSLEDIDSTAQAVLYGYIAKIQARTNKQLH